MCLIFLRSSGHGDIYALCEMQSGALHRYVLVCFFTSSILILLIHRFSFVLGITMLHLITGDRATLTFFEDFHTAGTSHVGGRDSLPSFTLIRHTLGRGQTFIHAYVYTFWSTQKLYTCHLPVVTFTYLMFLTTSSVPYNMSSRLYILLGIQFPKILLHVFAKQIRHRGVTRDFFSFILWRFFNNKRAYSEWAGESEPDIRHFVSTAVHAETRI